MRDVRIIQLNGGLVAKVDECDYEMASKFKWSLLNVGGVLYARRTIRSGDKQKTVLLHREIMQPRNGMVVDHINGDGLDCTRENMRIVTRAQNNINKRVKRVSRTGVKGVRKHSMCNKFSAEIKPPNGKRIYLGLFETVEAAASAYKAASEIHHGEFRREK